MNTSQTGDERSAEKYGYAYCFLEAGHRRSRRGGGTDQIRAGGAGGRGAGNMPPVAGNLVGHGPRAGGNAGPVRRSDGGHGAETVQALHAIFIYLFEVGQDAFLDMFFHNM